MTRDRGADPWDIQVVPRQHGKGTPLDRLMQVPEMQQDWRTGFGLAHDIMRGLSLGSVIRWVNSHFTYVALKTPRGWYTTATDLNTHVDQVMSDSELANLLDGEMFAVATSWELLNEAPF